MPITIGQPGQLHVDDVGVLLRSIVKDQNEAVVDLSEATSLAINFQRPNGTSFTREADTINDGTDGLMGYVTQAGDLNVDGYWYVQAQLTFDDGAELKSNRIRVRVLPNNATPA